MELAGRRVAVVGLGVSGFSAARRLIELGALVFATDANTSPAIEERAATLRAAGARVETGAHELDDLDAELAVVSPGIPPGAPVVLTLRAAAITVIGEVELASRLARCDFLAVTGTNGKTTTTALLAAILARSDVPSVAAGNIGLPLIDAITTIPSHGAIAVEVSSFQLDTIERFAPHVAIVLNVAEDHIDWHGTFEAYVDAKARIVANQGPNDVCVVNACDHHALEIASRGASRIVPFSAESAPGEGIGVRRGTVVWRGRTVFDAGLIPLPGVAGLEDALAAAGAALEYGVDPRIVAQAVEGFRPLHHRLEPVGELNGVSFIDDSKATNPHATLSAVRGLENVVLIAGGRAKGNDLAPLASTVPPVIAVVAIGESSDEIVKVFEGLVPVEKASSMKEAVALARRHAAPGGSVLLSPGCASLDMYDGYAARGADFERAVRALDDREGRQHRHA
ncbi:MAG: UDP-N-acetylmuramoyl-L-alanine--D-glutamate ligase [Actinomycetota bacterium]